MDISGKNPIIIINLSFNRF